MSTRRQQYLRMGDLDLSDLITACALTREREMPGGLPGLEEVRVSFHMARPVDIVVHLAHLVGQEMEIEVREQRAPRSPSNPAHVFRGFLVSIDTPLTIVPSGQVARVEG